MANFILIAFAPEAVKIFAPSQYYDAIWVIPPVAIGVYYMFCYDLFSKFAFYYEKRLFITAASVIAAGLNIILNIVCIKNFGYMAAGYTTLICYIICALGHYLFMNKVCDACCDGSRPYNGKIIVLISAVFTVCGLLMLLTYPYMAVRYAVIAIGLVALFLFRKRLFGAAKKLLVIRTEE